MHLFFAERLFLKCNENAVFFLKITHNKVKGPFLLEKGPLRYVMFSDCPYFLFKTLNKVYSSQSKKLQPYKQKKIHNTLLQSITFSLQKPWL